MIQGIKSKKEIQIVLFAFIVIASLVVISRIFSYFQIDSISKSTSYIYEHPFKVSNAALNIKLEVYKIHRDMKDVVLSSSKEELDKLVKEVGEHEKHVYKNLNIIEENILNKDALTLHKQTKELFKSWKPIRDEVIRLIETGKTKEAIAITQGKGAKHVLKLENSSNELYEYAQNKAVSFMDKSKSGFDTLKLVNFGVSVLLLFTLLIIAYYIIKRISKYIYVNEHLSRIAYIIKELNRLASREKNIQLFIDKSCEILISNNRYTNAWIVLLEDEDKVQYFASSIKTESSNEFDSKLRKCWSPECLKYISSEDSTYTIYENSKQNCHECPLLNVFEDNTAFNLKIVYKEHFYGYLTLSVNRVFTENKDEIELLKQYADDIAYAIYNLKAEENLSIQQDRYENEIVKIKELYDNIINSVDNLIFAKDTDFTYIACNKAFADFVGKTKDDIVGKSDYDIFDKDDADFFRIHDEYMLRENEAKSNFEWVTYPDGSKVYLLTTKSPLHDSQGDIFGLVGVSADLTEQKNIEEALKISKSRYEIAEKMGKVGSWEYIVETREFWASNESKEIYGLPLESESFSTDEIENCIPERERVHQALVDLLEKGSEYNLEFEINPYNGGEAKIIYSVAKVQFNETGIPEKVIGFIQDITEKTHNIRLLDQKMKELESIIMNAPNPIMIHEEGGKILMLNQAWTDSSGYTLEDSDSLYVWIETCFRGIDIIAAVKEHIKSVYSITEKVDDGEFTFYTKNEEQITWQFSSAPIGEINGKRTIVTSAMDITELKHKDEMIIRQSRHAAMGEMIGMIAHQWRQPISVIAMDANNMLVDIALNNFIEEKAEEYSRSILEQTQHLSDTIDDFRNFFKPDKEATIVEMSTIIKDTYPMVKDSINNNHIEFRSSYESESKVYAFERELMQVFVNIINNAKDSLIVNNTENALISVRVYDDEEYVNTEVFDNGGGIDDAIIEKIFDPYFTTKDEKTGTGLGLYMSKMIIEEHLHGIIEAYNKDDGACFRVRLLKEKG